MKVRQHYFLSVTNWRSCQNRGQRSTCLCDRDITDSQQTIGRSVSGNISLETRCKRKRETMGGFFCLSARTALERNSLTLQISLSLYLARADRFQAGLSTLTVISLWFIKDQSKSIKRPYFRLRITESEESKA